MTTSLVVQTSFLGDMVLTTPLLAELAGRGPVDVVATPANAPLLARVRLPDTVTGEVIYLLSHRAAKPPARKERGNLLVHGLRRCMLDRNHRPSSPKPMPEAAIAGA